MVGLGDILGSVGTLLGLGAAKGDVETAEEQTGLNLAELQGIALPDYEKMKRQYALYQAGKEYTPEQLIAEQMLQDYLGRVSADPELMAKQRQYMTYLEDISKKGMTPDEAAARNALMRQLEASQQSKLADIERQTSQVGMGSSGAAMLAKLTAQQQAQNVASEQAQNLAAQMAQRQMGAQGALAKQAGTLEEQQYARALEKAKTRQALDQFNLQQRAKSKEINVAAMNEAQKANLARQQKISDANIAMSNKQQEYNKELERQRYLDQLQKYGFTSEARLAEAASRRKRAGRVAGEVGAIGQTIGSIGDYLIGTPETEKKV